MVLGLAGQVGPTAADGLRLRHLCLGATGEPPKTHLSAAQHLKRGWRLSNLDPSLIAANAGAGAVMHGVKLRTATGWTVADLDAQRRAVVLELLRARIISLCG